MYRSQMKVELVHLVEIIHGGRGMWGGPTPCLWPHTTKRGTTELGLPKNVNTGSE